MWERFTHHAKVVVSEARDQAVHHNSESVGAEHLLLAMCFRPECIAMRTLKALEVDTGEFMASIGQALSSQEEPVSRDDVAFAPNAKRVLEQAVEEAQLCHDSYIGTEHLLLGLIRVSEGIAAKTLTASNVEYDRTKAAVLRLFDENRSSDAPS